MSMPTSRIASPASCLTRAGLTPALSTWKRSPPSCRSSPSAIWLLAELPVQRMSARLFSDIFLSRGIFGVHDLDGAGGVIDHVLRDAPFEQPPQAGVAARAHDDEVGSPLLRLLNDGRAGLAVAHRRLDRQSLLAQPPADALQTLQLRDV